MVFFVLDMKNNTLCIILATRFTLLVERSWKKHVFYSKLACPPATYDVISRNHRHWPSLNFSQNVRSRGINEKFYRLRKKLNPSERGWQPSPPPFNICWNEFKCLPSNLRAGVDVWTQYTLSHLKIYNNLLIIMMMRTTRTRSTSIHPIKFGYDVSVRSPVRTDAGGGFGYLSSVVRSFTKIYKSQFRDIFESLEKRYKLCMNWRLDLMQTNLLPFVGFRKIFINRSFCKWPL